MGGTVLQTPQLKRRRSDSPSSSLSNHVNKRFYSETLASPSPKAVRFDPAINGADNDAVEESDVPESPIREHSQAPAVPGLRFTSGQPNTPINGINGPLKRLNLKASAQKMVPATPLAFKATSERPKSVRKSAKKTPGSTKANKVLPFRIKVRSRDAKLMQVLVHIINRSPVDCDANIYAPSLLFSGMLASRFKSTNLHSAAETDYSWDR